MLQRLSSAAMVIMVGLDDAVPVHESNLTFASSPLLLFPPHRLKKLKYDGCHYFPRFFFYTFSFFIILLYHAYINITKDAAFFSFS
jgi:hypothetical protein